MLRCVAVGCGVDGGVVWLASLPGWFSDSGYWHGRVSCGSVPGCFACCHNWAGLGTVKDAGCLGAEFWVYDVFGIYAFSMMDAMHLSSSIHT